MRSSSIVVALAVLVSVVSCAPNVPKCPAVDTDPLSNSSAVLLESDDRLVSFLGDVELADGSKKSFVALKPTSISKGGSGVFKPYQLVVNTDCAEFDFKMIYYNGSYSVAWVDVELGFAINGETTCFIPNPFIGFDDDSYWTCQNQNYSCINDDGDEVATINLADLKIELDRKSSAPSGHFSKKPNQCR